MSRKTFIPSVLAAALLILTPLAGEARGVARPVGAVAQTLNVAVFAEPANLDFLHEHEMGGTMVDWDIYDQLARYNYQKQALEPELATSWKQTSPTTWIVNLRHGVQFQFGYGEMTAADVAFGVNYALSTSSDISFLYSGIKKVVALSKYQVEYVLTAPDTAFLMAAVQGFGGQVLSSAAYKKLGAQAFGRKPVGSGPFEVQNWVSGDHITLVRNPTYWNAGQIKLQTINIRFVPDPTVKENLLTTGQVQFVDAVNYQDISKLQANPDLRVDNATGWNWNYISFGTVDGPFGNKLVREAFQYAIDRQQIAQAVYFGWARPAYSPLPPNFMYADPALDALLQPVANDAKAKALLKQAGYPNGFSYTAIVPNTADIQREAVIIAQQLQAVGIKLTLKIEDNATYDSQQRKAGAYVDFNQITIMSPDPDSAINWFWHTDGILTRNYSDPTIDKLIDEGRALPDGPKRQAIYQSLQKAMLDQSWFVYVDHRSLVRVMSKHVMGYVATPQDMDAFNFRSVYMQ
jgi:peptide/nickel transport system substrate-binding protein